MASVLALASVAYATSTGDLDRSFGHHGLRIVRNANDYSRAVAVGRKGGIVVAGGDTVARLRPNGRLDRSFAGGGIARIEIPSGISVFSPGYSSLAVGPKGGIFVAAPSCTPDERSCGFAVVHLKRDGDVDRSFGQGGTVLVAFPAPKSFSLSPSVAIARGGKPVVTGLICRLGRDCNLALARLTRHGRLDPSFGDGGKLIASPGGQCLYTSSELSSMAVDSRGRIVMGAFCGRKISLARFRPDGHFDRSFGRRGKVNRKHLRISWASALAVDPKDRIDVVGARPPDGYGLARFQRNGKVDSSFGNHGTAGVRFDEKRVEYASATSAAIDSRGRIVVAGSAFGFSFARFTPHGHLDHPFGRHGRVVTGRSVGGGSTGQGLRGATSVTIDRRGRIVAAGYQRKSGESHFAVVRLLG